MTDIQVEKNLGTADDLLLDANTPYQIYQTRNGQQFLVTKINADTLPFEGKPGDDNFKSIKTVVQPILTIQSDLAKALAAIEQDKKICNTAASNAGQSASEAASTLQQFVNIQVLAGAPGAAPIWVDNTLTLGSAVSITSIDRISGPPAAGTTDTYRITLNDGTTTNFNVINGTNGDGAGDMLKSDNLSGLTNVELARENLQIKNNVLSAPVLTVDGQTINSSAFEKEVDTYIGEQTAANWYIYNPDGTLNPISEMNSDKLVSFQLQGLEPLTTYIIKKENISNNFKSPISNEVSVTTPNAYTTSTLSVENTDNVAPLDPELTIDYEPIGHSEGQISTTWRIIKVSDGSIAWEVEDDTTNLLSVDVPSGVLEVSTEYRFEGQTKSTNYTSNLSTIVMTTTDSSVISAVPDYATGNRFALITISSDYGFYAGAPQYGKYQDLINGTNDCTIIANSSVIGKEIKLEFAEDISLASFQLTGSANDNSIGSWNLQVSLDGNTWETVGAIDAIGQKVTFSRVTAKYIRMYGISGTAVAGSCWYQILLGDD